MAHRATVKKHANPKKLKMISFVIPVHNEALNAPLLYYEILKHVKKLPYKYEFIYVDDGSKDASAEAIEQLAKSNQNIRLIQLSRNFGKEAAVSAGQGLAHMCP